MFFRVLKSLRPFHIIPSSPCYHWNVRWLYVNPQKTVGIENVFKNTYILRNCTLLSLLYEYICTREIRWRCLATKQKHEFMIFKVESSKGNEGLFNAPNKRLKKVYLWNMYVINIPYFNYHTYSFNVDIWMIF